MCNVGYQPIYYMPVIKAAYMWFDVCTVAVLINCGSYVIYPRIVYVCIRTLASLQVQSPNAAIGSRVIFLLVEAFSTKTFFFFLS